MEKIINGDGHLVCPAFDGTTGERVLAFDMHIWLGATKDPARKHFDKVTSITIHDDLYFYEFQDRCVNGKDVFSMTVTPHNDAAPIGMIGLDQDVGDRFYKVSRVAYERFHRVGVKEEERIENERRR